MSDQDVPDTPPPSPTLPVNQEWLEKVVCEKYAAKGEIENVSCETIGEGKGFLSVMTMATLSWNGPDSTRLPKAVVIKQPTYEKVRQVPMLAALYPEAILTDIHNTEVRAYKFFNLKPEAPFPMAKLLYAENRDEQKPGLLIMEAVDGRSPTFNDDYTIDQIKALLDTIASLQAYAFTHKESESYIGDMPMKTFAYMTMGATEGAKKMRETYPDVFTLQDDTIEAAAEKAKELALIIMDKKELSKRYHPAVCFGDMQQNNILWKVNPDGSLSNEIAALLDFQLAHWGGPAYDVGVALTRGASVDMLKTETDHLLTYFYSSLEQKLGTEPPYTFEELRSAYHELSTVFGVMMIGMVNELVSYKDVFGLTDARLKQMVEKIVYIIESSGVV